MKPAGSPWWNASLLVAAALLASAACSGAVALDPLAPVPTRVSPDEISTPPLRVAWTVSSRDEDGDREVPTHAAAVGTSAIFVAYESRLDALDVEDGTKLWEAHLPGPLAFAPVAFRGGVAVASGTRWLWFDASGAATASADLGSSVNDALVVTEGMVVVSNEEVRRLDLSAAGGLTVAWSTSLPGGRRISASPDGGALYISNEDGSLTALATATGTVRWRSAEIELAPLRPATGKAIYVIDRNGRLHALRHRDGKHMWAAKDIGMRIEGSPVERDGLIWIPGLDAAVHAFTAGGGSHQHRISGNGRIHLDAVAWGPWIIASPQYGPWLIVQGPRTHRGPADPGSPRILRIDSADDLAIAPAVDAAGEIGVVVIDAAGMIRLLTPEQGAEVTSEAPGQ